MIKFLSINITGVALQADGAEEHAAAAPARHEAHHGECPNVTLSA